MKNLWKLVTSKKVALNLLFLMIFLLVTGSFLPRISFITDQEKALVKANEPIRYFLAQYISPPQLAKSSIFFLLAGILFLTLILCTVKRIRNRKKTGFNPTQVKFSFDLTGISPPEISALLKKKYPRYRWQSSCQQNPQGEVMVGRRGRYGFWGSVVFHLSLVLIIVAGFTSYLFSFKGGLVVTEGQEVNLSTQNLVNVIKLPVLGNFEPNIMVRLINLKIDMYNKNYIKQYVAKTDLLDSEKNLLSSQDVSVNNPLSYKGYKFVLEDYGVAPYFVFKDKKTGKALSESFFNLRVLKKDPADTADIHDSIQLPGDDNHFMFRFFPDFVREGNKIGTRSVFLKNPVFWVTMGNVNKLLPLGGSADLGNYTIEFKEYRYWSYYKVSNDPGAAWVYLGFFTALAGLILRFWDNEKVFWFQQQPQDNGMVRVSIGGYSKYFPAIFEDQVAELKNLLATYIKGA